MGIAPKIEDKNMIRQLKAVGGAVMGIGAGIVRTVRFLWAVGVLIFTAFLVSDLCRIPASVNNSWKYAVEQTLWRKMSPQEEQRLQNLQEHCHHIYRRENGLWTYYCPLCRKKLTKATAPLWQI